MERMASNTTKIEADWIYCDAKQNESLLLSTKTKRKKVVLTGTCAALKEVINNKNFKLIHENIDPLFQKKSTYRSAFSPTSKKKFHFDSVNNNDIIATTIDIWPYIQQNINIPDYDIHVFLKESEEADLDMLEASIDEPITFICSIESNSELASKRDSTTSLYAELLRNNFLLSQSVDVAKDIAFVQKSINKLQSQEAIEKLEGFYGPLKELTLQQQEMLAIVDCKPLRMKILRHDIISTFLSSQNFEIKDKLSGIAKLLITLKIDPRDPPQRIKEESCEDAFQAFQGFCQKVKESIGSPKIKTIVVGETASDRDWGLLRESIEEDYTYTPETKTVHLVLKWVAKILNSLGISNKIKGGSILINKDVENNLHFLRAHSLKHLKDILEEDWVKKMSIQSEFVKLTDYTPNNPPPKTILSDNFGVQTKYLRVLRSIKLEERDKKSLGFINTTLKPLLEKTEDTIKKQKIKHLLRSLTAVENIFGVTSIEIPKLGLEKEQNQNLTALGIMDENIPIKDFLHCMNGKASKYDMES